MDSTLLILPLVLLWSSGAADKARMRENVYTNFFDPLSLRFSSFPPVERRSLLSSSRSMFRTAFDCYMRCAFPMDELDPIACRGRGPDREDTTNININDVLGGYSLSLVDSLSTLAVMGEKERFQKAVKDVVEQVSFDQEGATVQVFEANIRMLGGLLSAHLLMSDPAMAPFGAEAPEWYSDDLLTLAHDLADRLLSAFGGSPPPATGLPHPRVNLVSGVPKGGFTTTCTAGAGSLILEMGVMSRLLGDPTYEAYAERAVRYLWQRRDNATGLMGNVIDINTGEWVSKFSGLGAGIDSYYEYLLKSHVLFGGEEDDEDEREEEDFLSMFDQLYTSATYYMRKGRQSCNGGSGGGRWQDKPFFTPANASSSNYDMHPIYVNVDMSSGQTANTWVDSLQAAFPGLQVLHGDLQEAICQHALYYALWLRYDGLPERYNWKSDSPDVRFYPLRPEFVEATYFLYRATGAPFYLHVGRDVIKSLENHTRTNCGYATVHDVLDKSLEDRQESFFLAETCKYLYLLFDTENPANKLAEKYLFTTEGHILPITAGLRRKPWEEEDLFGDKNVNKNKGNGTTRRSRKRRKNFMCENPGADSPFELPLKSRYLAQILEQFGLPLEEEVKE